MKIEKAFDIEGDERYYIVIDGVPALLLTEEQLGELQGCLMDFIYDLAFERGKKIYRNIKNQQG